MESHTDYIHEAKLCASNSVAASTKRAVSIVLFSLNFACLETHLLSFSTTPDG